MQSATTSDGGRTWTNADKTYRKAGNESVQIPRGIYAIQDIRFPIETKSSGTRGRSTLELVDYDGLLLVPPKFEPI